MCFTNFIDFSDKCTDESKYPKKTHFFHPYNLRYRHGGKHKKLQKASTLDDGDLHEIHNIKKKVEAAFTPKGKEINKDLKVKKIKSVDKCDFNLEKKS